jgi:hypothetical protein
MKLNTFSKKNTLLELAALGQSIWLDYTRRDFIENNTYVEIHAKHAIAAAKIPAIANPCAKAELAAA